MFQENVWMERCLELARLGSGKVAPNPMVGAVVVAHGKIIGEGWHHQFGMAHAEVNAIENVKDKSLLKEAVLYVNLEPCFHYGKTPPCANLIIAHNIPEVVVGMRDPNPLVAGKGVELLRNAGIKVSVGVLEDKCLALNKRFICSYTKHRPYVILKWAQTLNGFLSPDATKMSKEQFEKERHITGFLVQKLVHKWRTQEDAIMVATHTVELDNPALDARAWEGRAPARVVLDQKLRLPLDLKVFNAPQKTFIVNGSKDLIKDNLHYLKVDFSSDWLAQMLAKLHHERVQSLVIEGGAKLLNTVVEQLLWDEAIVFYSPKHISTGVVAPTIGGSLGEQEEIDGVKMRQYFNL
ncbi:MAG: bifunctional diaminohydroxyphosphoribosylaminopyrimidine deaminase/5-amino-6-(5-phosphoribosylamino)uracil reductase RibD [bacterium]|nr:bifunctional diaminohydroxyphosphoribosylaminopyrimidine deaminase/5-amino-6-(5-phosphoribosylamino)uracil reductase RibD [bacterium]